MRCVTIANPKTIPAFELFGGSMHAHEFAFCDRHDDVKLHHVQNERRDSGRLGGRPPHARRLPQTATANRPLGRWRPVLSVFIFARTPPFLLREGGRVCSGRGMPLSSFTT
jgi:hypothetical protein